MKPKSALFVSAMLASGVALACANLPMPIPPVPVSIGWAAVTLAASQGFSNPLHAASMKSLDSRGSAAVGAATWQANSYFGYVSFIGPLGGPAAIIYTEKPCGKKAIESSPKTGGTAGGGGGGDPSGGGSSGGGGGYIGGGTNGGCVGDCDGTVEVGEVRPV